MFCDDPRLNFAKELFSDREALVCHCLPEVEVLVEVRFDAWSIADDTETEEGHLP